MPEHRVGAKASPSTLVATPGSGPSPPAARRAKKRLSSGEFSPWQGGEYSIFSSSTGKGGSVVWGRGNSEVRRQAVLVPSVACRLNSVCMTNAGIRCMLGALADREYGSFHLSLLTPKDTTKHRVTSRDVAARDRPPTGRPPAAHRQPTGRPPAAHRPPTGRPPAVHRPPTGRPPAAHRPPTGRPPE